MTREAQNIKLPVWYDSVTQVIMDAEDKLVCEIRGWGWIQYGRTEPGGMIYQDTIGKALADGFNKEFKKTIS